MLIVLWSDKVAHRSYRIYEGKCCCGSSYIGETKKPSEVRWKEHKDPAGKSESVKHLIEKAYHQFTWIVFSVAPSHFCRGKILEAFFIALRKPELNDQLQHHSLFLFRHGIT